MICAEAFDVLCRSSTFRFRGETSVAQLPRALHPGHLHQLRSLSLSTSFWFPARVQQGTELSQRCLVARSGQFVGQWEFRYGWFEACEVLASMKQLKRLRITIEKPPNSFSSLDEQSAMALLDPLRDVEVPVLTVVFGVFVQPAAREKFEDFPFTVVCLTLSDRVRASPSQAYVLSSRMSGVGLSNIPHERRNQFQLNKDMQPGIGIEPPRRD
ncbi:hypothetical protein BST61_g10448 [Cercospora zeina]